MAWLTWAIHRLGYVVRPYDTLADRRRWFWQERQRCGWSVAAGRPPMSPAQITDVVEGILDDILGDSEPADRHRQVAEALTESWIKDRGRALRHRTRTTETNPAGSIQ